LARATSSVSRLVSMTVIGWGVPIGVQVAKSSGEPSKT
jgi:hypothetical protein